MPALVAGIHAFLEFAKQDVDARHKAGMTVERQCVSPDMAGLVPGLS